MQVIEIEGLKGLHKLIAKLRSAALVYPDAQDAKQKTIHVDWHAKPLPGGTPKVTRIEIKVTNE